MWEMGDDHLNEEEHSESEEEEEDALDPLLPEEQDLEEEDKLFNKKLDEYLNKTGANKSKLSKEKTEEGSNAPSGFIVGLQEFNWNPHSKVAANLKGHKLHCDKNAHPK